MPVIGLNRQELCAALGVSESTIRRLELLGLPYTPVGQRAKRYNLAECRQLIATYTAANPHGCVHSASGNSGERQGFTPELLRAFQGAVRTTLSRP